MRVGRGGLCVLLLFPLFARFSFFNVQPLSQRRSLLDALCLSPDHQLISAGSPSAVGTAGRCTGMWAAVCAQPWSHMAKGRCTQRRAC